MSADDYIRQYIAAKLEVPAHRIASFKFEADPGRQYSTYTKEEFDCTIIVTLTDDTEHRRYLGASETCAFLNGFGEAVRA